MFMNGVFSSNLIFFAANLSSTTNFTNWDWIIVIVYLIASIAVGVYANRYIANIGDYLVAGRGLGVYIAVATMTGTELGLVTVMYNAEEGFLRGFSAFSIGLIACCTSVAIGLSGFVVSQLREEGVMTIPEYYEKRFGPKVRWIGGVVLTIACVLNFALFLKIGARFVTCVTGLEEGPMLKLVMSAMLCLVLLYTALGGMISVVITDYIQFVVLVFGLAIATGYVVEEVGWHNMVTTVLEHKGEGGFNPIKTSGYGWIFILWMTFLNLSAQVAWLPSTLRALSAKNATVARKLYIWSGLSFLMRCLLPMVWGIAAYTFIIHTPDLREAFFPKQGDPIYTSQHAMPILFARVIPAGLIGFIAAGMMAAFMSTHDSYLLAFSSVVTQDVIAPLCKRDLSSRARIWITRVAILVMGGFLLFWGLWYEPPESIWKYMAATGTIYLPGAFACLLGGLYWKRASSTGAAIAIGCGLIGLLGIVDWNSVSNYITSHFNHSRIIVSNIAEIFKSLTQNNIAIITICVSLIGMVLGSLLFPDEGKVTSQRPVQIERKHIIGGGMFLIVVGAIIAVASITDFSGSFWLWIFVVGSILFFGMAAIVIVMGFKDMKMLFKMLTKQHEAEKEGAQQ